MNSEQYERWKDFAIRMAQTCFKESRRPSQAWIIAEVESWFWWRDYQEDWSEYNSWDQDRHPLCDHVAEFWSDDIPRGGTCKACKHDCPRGYPRYDREAQCRYCDMECRCDEIEMLCYEQFNEQWLSPVHCCIRAGIDCACAPSAGVLGFTAGDVRRMYPEGVPDWVFRPDERLHYWMSDEVNGTFAELPDDAELVL